MARNTLFVRINEFLKYHLRRAGLGGKEVRKER